MGTGRREHWTWIALFGLFLVFLVGVVYSNHLGSEIVVGTAPSSLNAHPPGAKAFYLLCQHLGYSTDRLETDWRGLDAHDGLVLAIEPFTDGRRPTAIDLSALKAWVDQGGSVLYGVTSPPRPTDPDDPLLGDVPIVPAPNVRATIPVHSPDTQVTAHVRSIAVQSPVRIEPPIRSAYKTVIADSWGAILVRKRIGRGSLFLFADDRLTSNAGIDEFDNAVLMVNIVSASVNRSRPTVLFDEYHHGAGISSAPDDLPAASIWSAAPVPLRLLILYLLPFAALLIYSDNRRFGPPRLVPAPHRHAKAQFLSAMVRVMRTAFAGDLVIETLYGRFRADLTRQQHLARNASTTLILQRLESTLGQDVSDLGTLMVRCDQIVGGDRITDGETLRLANQIDGWHRRLRRVG